MDVRKNKKRLSVAAKTAIAAVLGTGMFSASAFAQATSGPIFDWSVVNGSGNANYTPAPILTDANASQISAFLTSRGNGVLAVKIVAPISQATANLIFNNHKVQYIFADFESSTSVAQTTALVNQILGSSRSSGAFIGEFNMYDTSNDPTRPNPVVSGAPSFPSTPTTSTEYKNAGLNMAMPVAYPGSPDYLSKTNSQVSFPNLRSAFFVLPIDRVTFATDMVALGTYPPTTPTNAKLGSYQNIPWVARFNNYGNSALNNDAGYEGYKYAFNTTGANNPYANQLLSAGDFSAQMLQYRLRGATSFNLFNYSQSGATGSNETYSSVIGYTVAQEQSDALKGWNAVTSGSSTNSTLGAIWGRKNYAYANLDNNVPTAPNQVSSASATGMVLSGIYDVSGSTRQLALMLSNMNSKAETVDFWQKYGGASVDLNGKTSALDQIYTIQPGTHQLLQFNLTGGKWVMFANNEVFADSNRNGIGVPEPTSIGLLALAGAGLLLRRRRQASKNEG